MEFLELKRNRAANFERIKDSFDRELYELREKSSHRRLLKRLEEALREIGRLDVWTRIRDCTEGQRCGSLWCATCRNQAAIASENKIKERVRAKGYQNKDLLHITAPVGLASVDPVDVNRVLKDDALRWKRIRKKHQFWIEATYEFELVNYQFLMRSKGSERKKMQMSQLVQATGFAKNEFLFIHWHGVTDMDRKAVTDTFGKEYFFGDDRLHKTSTSGLYVQGFRSEQDLETNIAKIASYPFKSVYRFKHSFKGSDFANGEYLTTTELGHLVALYQDIQGRQWRSLRRHNGKN